MEIRNLAKLTGARVVCRKSFKRLTYCQLPDTEKYRLTDNPAEEHSMTTPFRLVVGTQSGQ